MTFILCQHLPDQHSYYRMSCICFYGGRKSLVEGSEIHWALYMHSNPSSFHFMTRRLPEPGRVTVLVMRQHKVRVSTWGGAASISEETGNVQRVKKAPGIGGAALVLRASLALPEDSGSSPSTHLVAHSSRAPCVFFWSPRTPGTHVVHVHIPRTPGTHMVHVHICRQDTHTHK